MLKQMAVVSLSLALCLGLGGCGTTKSSPASGSSSPANVQSSKAKASKEDVLELLEHGKFTKAEEAAKSSNISKTERAQVLAYGAAKYIGSRSSAPSSMYEFLDCQLNAFANSDLKLIDEIHDGFNSFISSVKNAYSDNYEKVEDLDSMCSSLADKLGETGYNTAIEIAKQNANQKNLVATTDASNIEQRLQEQPAFVSSSSYEVQDPNLKSLYPDMLCFSVQNNTGKDMKNATVALTAWDCNNMPVVITDTTSICPTARPPLLIMDFDSATHQSRGCRLLRSRQSSKTQPSSMAAPGKTRSMMLGLIFMKTSAFNRVKFSSR